MGFDVVINAPAPQTWKKLVREAFLKFANLGKASEQALFSCGPQMAIKYQIPIIYWAFSFSFARTIQKMIWLIFDW